MKLKVVYVDMDDVLVDFQSGIDSLSDEEREVYKDNIDNAPGGIVYIVFINLSFFIW